MSEDKGRPRGPQLPRFLFLSPEEREKSTTWRILRAMGESLARFRERLPRYTLERLERLRAMQPQLPAYAAKLARQWHEAWEEQAQAAQACRQQPSEDPVEQPLESVKPLPESIELQPELVDQPSSKRGPGAPRLDIPHVGEALAALREKRPDPRSKVTKEDINLVFDFLDGQGIKLDRAEKESTIRRYVTADRKQRLEL